ncbi:MAG: DUF5115 domain-containing protein [Prevotella sp.]|nr:DUF5115 domain-containing protein [Prevotella sp.]
MKKFLYTIGLALLVVSCTEDFKDWASPFKNDPEAAKSMSMSINPVGTIDLATVTTETVQIFTPSITIDDEAETTYQATIYGPEEGDEAEFGVGADGSVLTSALEVAVYSLYGQRPVTRNIPMDVVGFVKVGGQTFKAIGKTTLSVIPNAPEIEAAYYLTGSINGWDNSDTTYKLTNDGSDPYENPTYTCRIPAPEDGSNIEFKMTPESGLGGDWSKCLAAGDEGKFKYNNDGGNLVINAVAGAKFYDLTFNMLDQTWEAKALLFDIEQNWYLTGSINGWNNSDTTYKMTNDGRDPYENPTFTMRIPAPEDGGNIEFKMTPESGLGGNWSKCLAAGSGPAGTFAYNNDGGNLVIEAVEGAKYYDVTFNMMELTWSYKAISFEPFVYFIGATDGWSASDQKLALANEDGVYTGYLYVADPNGWGVEFKFQKVPGDWGDDSQLNSNNLAEITGDFAKGGDNIVAAGGEGVYYVTLDLASKTLNGLKITNMNLVGDFNGWNAGDDAQQMTWDAEHFCYVITGAAVTANGWKFTTNNSWDVNLGGDTLDNLVANGSNLTAVGTTIKLYPTRKTSDNIYCTVE